MAYTPTIFEDNVTPLNAEVLNKSEQQLKIVSDSILNPVGEVAEYATVKATTDMHVGKRGVVGPPNFNNLYVSGSIYTGPKEEMPTITGPGAQGGNIYMPHTKAICGLTKEGPIAANPDLGIAADSGVRTIAFAGRVFQEDIDNLETSIYLGTNVSRMYFYSRTAYPTIVSNRSVHTASLPVANEEPDLTVQTVSPVATQEWVTDLMELLGVTSNKEDTTVYVTASTRPGVAFDKITSASWFDFSHTWITNEDTGVISSDKTTGKSRMSALFQNPGTWNEIYLKIPTTNIDLILAQTNGANKFLYGVTFAENVYRLFSLDTTGRKYFDYIYPNANNIVPNATTRVRYDETNSTFVISSIDTGAGTEKELVRIPLTNFAGFQEFTTATPSIGIAVNVTLTVANIAQIVAKPAALAQRRLRYVLDERNHNPYVSKLVIPSAKTGNLVAAQSTAPTTNVMEMRALAKDVEDLKHAVYPSKVMAKAKASEKDRLALEKYINTIVEQKVAEAMRKIKR